MNRTTPGSTLQTTLSRTICATFAVFLTVLSLNAYAGQACTEKELAPTDVRAALTLALDLAQELDRDHAEVAIVARVGRDLSRYGLRYSHVAFAWRGHPRGAWTMVEELNQCGTAHSALYDDGFGNFFLDDMFAYEAKVVIPTPDVQRRIAAVLASGAAGHMHDPHYNLVAYPWSTRYQNSNQWLLETLAEALDPQPVATRADAQAWLRDAGYSPTRLQLSPLERLGGELFSANVAFDDHPQDLVMAGEIDVVSAESALAFVIRTDPGATVRVLSVDPRPPRPSSPAIPAPQATPPVPAPPVAPVGTRA